MTDAYIYDHVRTPRGRGSVGGALQEAMPVHLAATVLAALRRRNDLDTSQVSDVILGVVASEGNQGHCLPRSALLTAGYAQATAGLHVNRLCASGLEACNLAAAKIMAGQVDMAIGGGCESLSRLPVPAEDLGWTCDPHVAFAAAVVPQGISADLIASKWGYAREALDALAVESHRRAARAWREGRFTRAIVPVLDPLGDALLTHDETVRTDCTAEDLRALPATFGTLGARGGFDRIAMLRYPELAAIHHVHHAGNSAAPADGAAAVLLGSRESGHVASLLPRARIRAFAEVGSEPTIMLTAPACAAQKALNRAGMRVTDIDLFEVNEAFAAVPMRFAQTLDVDPDRVNVNGGSIAMGHPLGATGAMLLGLALDELERAGLSTALVTMSVGAGMGVATIIERV